MTDTATDRGAIGIGSPSGLGSTRTSRRTTRAHRAAALAVSLTAAATLLLGAGTGAQEADAAEVATPTPAPTLTMAPLVTLPPIATPRDPTPVESADGYALGAAEAPVLVEVWEDFQCPYCQRFSLTVKPLIVETYVTSGQVRYVFRDLPFIGEGSKWAAVAASLAADQNLFWPFHDHLFANFLGQNVGSYDLDRLLAIGELVGLDMEVFTAGLQIEAARDRFAQIEARARTDAGILGINATPTVVVNGVPLTSPDWETVRTAIDAALDGS